VRPQLAVAGVLFLALLLFPGGRIRRDGWRRAAIDLALFAAPVVAVGLLLAWYNEVRFDNPFVFGHEYLQAGRLDRVNKWGLFNYHFLPINLTAALTVLPKFTREAPYVQFSLHGMCIFLSTPVLVYLAAARYASEDRTSYLWHRVLWATAAAVAIPGFLYQNTGWEQYGFRFSMDWIAFLILLLALSRRRITWLFMSLAAVGFLVNAWGAIAFKRGPPFDRFFDTWLTP
ncbi:MAG: hypothetical protein QME96_09900, partial [Myxococcota bacterium]|nr:hypothetical protein [Myxococcota bacterium]